MSAAIGAVDAIRWIIAVAESERKGEVMKILFNLLTTIEISNADNFPPKEEVEKMLVEFFAAEGMIAHGLEVTNYCASDEEAERRTDG